MHIDHFSQHEVHGRMPPLNAPITLWPIESGLLLFNIKETTELETQLIFELLSVIGEQKSRGAKGQKDPVD